AKELRMAENGALSFGVAPYAEGTSSTKFVGQIITSVVIFMAYPPGWWCTRIGSGPKVMIDEERYWRELTRDLFRFRSGPQIRRYDLLYRFGLDAELT